MGGITQYLLDNLDAIPTLESIHISSHYGYGFLTTSKCSQGLIDTIKLRLESRKEAGEAISGAAARAAGASSADSHSPVFFATTAADATASASSKPKATAGEEAPEKGDRCCAIM